MVATGLSQTYPSTDMTDLLHLHLLRININIAHVDYIILHSILILPYDGNSIGKINVFLSIINEALQMTRLD
jgi:hypothetical protein